MMGERSSHSEAEAMRDTIEHPFSVSGFQPRTTRNRCAADQRALNGKIGLIVKLNQQNWQIEPSDAKALLAILQAAYHQYPYSGCQRMGVPHGLIEWNGA